MWFRWSHSNLCPSLGPDCWWGRDWHCSVGAGGIITEPVRGSRVRLSLEHVGPLAADLRAVNRANVQQAAAKDQTRQYEKNVWRERGHGGDRMLVKAHLGISVKNEGDDVVPIPAAPVKIGVALDLG